MYLAERPSVASGTTSECWPNCTSTANIKQIDGSTHSRVAQPYRLHDLRDLDALFVQPRDLLAPLVKLLPSLVFALSFCLNP